jgi:hypothetical protein
MSLLELIKEAAAKEYVDEDGEIFKVEFDPPVIASQIGLLQSRLPAPIPDEVREVLDYCRGFSCMLETVDFSGDCGQVYEEAFPLGHPIAADGWGNGWVVDLSPASREWAPIYFVCHDGPVILYQSPTLEHFLTEVFKMGVPPHKNLIDDVHEDRLFNVWDKNPGTLSYEQCMESADAELKAFAGELGAGYTVIDMRTPQIGMGFTYRWGIRRFGELPIFAYKRPVGLLQKLFGKSK